MSSTVAQIRSRMPRIAEVPARLAGSHLRTSAVERARLTVVPRRRTRAARMPFVALVSMVLLGGVVGLLLFNTSMQQASFASTALEDQANTLAARQQTLQMDLDRLRDPQRIAHAARKLGMVQAGNPAFLSLGTGKVSGVPSVGGQTGLRINPLPPKKPALLSPKPHVVTVQPPTTAGSAGETSGDTAPGSAGNGTGRDRMDQSQENHRSHTQQ